MAMKVTGFIKMHIPAGNVEAATAVGPALGLCGLNILEFCRAFNDLTKNMKPGLSVPVVITKFADKSFSLNVKVR